MTPPVPPLTVRDVLRDCRAAAREAWQDVRDGLREKGVWRMLRAAVGRPVPGAGDKQEMK